MLTTTTAAYAASITGRNAGRPYIAISQLYLAAGPMCLGLILSPHTFYQVVGVALFLFMFGMTDITLSVRKTIVGALETKQKNVELAKSFESQAQALRRRAQQHVARPRDVRRARASCSSGTRSSRTSSAATTRCSKATCRSRRWSSACARTRAGHQRQDPLVEAIRHSFRSRAARQSFVKLDDGKVVSVSRQKMDNGNVVVVFEDVTEQTKAHERIRQLAWADDLTGLMNRASFKEVFKKTLDLMDDNATVALHLIDLDHFKSVNDTLGHPTGDLLLVEVAKRITAACGEEGVVARLGGDEFVIIQRLMVDGDSPGSARPAHHGRASARPTRSTATASTSARASASPWPRFTARPSTCC